MYFQLLNQAGESSKDIYWQNNSLSLSLCFIFWPEMVLICILRLVKREIRPQYDSCLFLSWWIKVLHFEFVFYSNEEWVGEWLLFNDNWLICQLYHSENKWKRSYKILSARRVSGITFIRYVQNWNKIAFVTFDER